MSFEIKHAKGQKYATAMASDGHQTIAGLLDAALDEIQGLPAEAFDELHNPFESKLVLRDKLALPAAVSIILSAMEIDARVLGQAFGVPSLRRDALRHYAGVFRYRPGDHLSAHVDAGIHPATGQRKHVTALLYLGESEGGELELWEGTRCTLPDPTLHRLVASIPPEHGRMVFFENNDYAWHSAAQNTGKTDRIVVTVSFLSDEVYAFENQRQRAFFAPRPDEKWTDEVYALRDLRSDSVRHAEAYRVGADGSMS